MKTNIYAIFVGAIFLIASVSGAGIIEVCAATACMLVVCVGTHKWRE